MSLSDVPSVRSRDMLTQWLCHIIGRHGNCNPQGGAWWWDIWPVDLVAGAGHHGGSGVVFARTGLDCLSSFALAETCLSLVHESLLESRACLGPIACHVNKSCDPCHEGMPWSLWQALYAVDQCMLGGRHGQSYSSYAWGQYRRPAARLVIDASSCKAAMNSVVHIVVHSSRDLMFWLFEGSTLEWEPFRVAMLL